MERATQGGAYLHSLHSGVFSSGSHASKWGNSMLGIAGDSWILDPSHERKLDSVMLPDPFLPFNSLEV